MRSALLPVIRGATLALAVVGCHERQLTRPAEADSTIATRRILDRDLVTWLKGHLAHPRAGRAGDPVVLAGAGDIARCYPGEDVTEFQPPGPENPATQTAALLESM